MPKKTVPDITAINAARRRIRSVAHRTPVLTSTTFDKRFGATLFFKCENFQKTGSFKMRGALNAVINLKESAARKGVVTDSSGNHGQALAYAASIRGIPAHIVMPTIAPPVKIAAVKGYGATIHLCEPSMSGRQATRDQVIKETGAAYISSCSHTDIIAGQATAFAELLEDAPDLDFTLTPVGGGGLFAGTLLSASYLSPMTLVIGVEPAVADDAKRSLAAGERIPSDYPSTIADGLKVSLGELPFDILSARKATIVTVSEEAIADATRYVWERLKIIIEPSSAVVIAALIEKKVDIAGKRVGLILSGGNVDLNHLPWEKSR